MLISPPPSAAQERDYSRTIKTYMARACHHLARTCRVFCPCLKAFNVKALRDHGNALDSHGAENSAVALDFRGHAECFRIIVRELDGRTAFDGGYLADQADGIKAAIAAGIASAKIVRQQRAPTC